MKMKKSEIIEIIILIILYMIGINIQNNIYLSILLVILMLYGFFILWKSIFEVKVFIAFILLYPYCFLQYLLFNKKLSAYVEFWKNEYLYDTGLTMFLFTMLLFVSLGVINKNNFEIKNKFNSKIIFYINLIVIIYFMITGVTGKLGAYREITLNPKIEYLIIPYIVLSYFCSKNIVMKIGYMYLIFSIYILLLGSRVPALFLIFVVLILNKKFLYKIKNNKGIIMILFGILVMKLVEKTRNINGNIFERIQIILSKETANTIISNEADVIYSATALIGLIKLGKFDINHTIKTCIYYLLDFFRIQISKEKMYIPSQVLRQTLIGGGGLINSQLYFFGREILIVIGAIFIGKCIKNLFLIEKRKDWKNIYSLILLITVFRWYAYGITPLYKMSLYAVTYYFINKIIFYVIKRSEK